MIKSPYQNKSYFLKLNVDIKQLLPTQEKTFKIKNGPFHNPDLGKVPNIIVTRNEDRKEAEDLFYRVNTKTNNTLRDRSKKGLDVPSNSKFKKNSEEFSLNVMYRKIDINQFHIKVKKITINNTIDEFTYDYSEPIFSSITCEIAKFPKNELSCINKHYKPYCYNCYEIEFPNTYKMIEFIQNFMNINFAKKFNIEMHKHVILSEVSNCVKIEINDGFILTSKKFIEIRNFPNSSSNIIHYAMNRNLMNKESYKNLSERLDRLISSDVKSIKLPVIKIDPKVDDNEVTEGIRKDKEYYETRIYNICFDMILLLFKTKPKLSQLELIDLSLQLNLDSFHVSHYILIRKLISVICEKLKLNYPSIKKINIEFLLDENYDNSFNLYNTSSHGLSNYHDIIMKILNNHTNLLVRFSFMKYGKCKSYRDNAFPEIKAQFPDLKENILICKYSKTSALKKISKFVLSKVLEFIDTSSNMSLKKPSTYNLNLYNN